MSEQKTEFDVWWEEEKLRSWLSMNSQVNQSHTEDNLPKEWSAAYKSHSKLAYEAATAEANKRMAELEGEVAELSAELGKLTARYGVEYAKFQANNHDLHEALRYFVDSYGYVSFISDDDKESEEQVISARKLLTATPAESLAKHDDEVIERCAKLCDPYTHGAWFANAIRALKVNK